MSTISASLVKELREQTGAGMMDCKAALAESNARRGEALLHSCSGAFGSFPVTRRSRRGEVQTGLVPTASTQVTGQCAVVCYDPRLAQGG